MQARILDITADQYHADPCVTPSLSASIAKILVDKSPMHAWAAHPRLGGKKFTSTKEMDRGTLCHRILLGKGADIVEIPFADYRKDVAKDMRDQAKSDGKIPALTNVLVSAHEMAQVHKKRLAYDHGIYLDGESEVAIEYSDELFMDCRRVVCRSMLDHVKLSGGVIYDLKFVACAHPDVVAKSIVSYGYDIQDAAYRRALSSVKPELTGREDFVFLFCEAEEPYAVQPYRLDGTFREHGQRRWDRAKRIWADCLKSNVWPGYAPGVVSVAPPQWAMARELEASIASGE